MVRTIASRAGNWSRTILKDSFKGQSFEFYALAATIGLLTVIGLFMVLSASYVSQVQSDASPFSKLFVQFIGVLIGLIGMLILLRMHPETIRRFTNLALVVSLFLQGLVFTFLGKEVNGNRNWLNLGPLSFQPSELLKVTLILVIAGHIATNRQVEKEDWRYWSYPVAIFVVIFGLVGVASKDFGTFIIMAFITFGMFYLGGLPWKFVMGFLALGAVGIPFAMLSSPSRAGRIMAWLDHNRPDPNQFNWQADHGIWAFASGGLIGRGFGESQMKWSWLPEAQNDFIFAVIGEEFGMIGCLVVIALFIFLAVIMMRIARKTADKFQKLVVYGVTAWIISQAFINISVVLTMLPVLGVNLPLISAGGTSIAITLTTLGLVLGIERSNSSKPKLRVVSQRGTK